MIVLINIFVKLNIIIGCKNIPNKNLCIKVKSTWTAKLHDGNIQPKQQARKELGFNYEIWIYDKEGNKLECLT
jgi:hypothetical protein